MDINIYEIIKGPLISEKAYGMNQKEGKLVLEVHPKANKHQIAVALLKLFNVKAEKIGIIVRKGKLRKSARHVFVGKTRKKAIVSLKKGQSVDIMGLAEPKVSQTVASE
jgi:large subunit ribosomal protein L23